MQSLILQAMALYTKRQFAELTAIPSKDLSNYIKRGHVVLQGGKCECEKFKCTCLIDDSNEINKLFMDRRGIEIGNSSKVSKVSKKLQKVEVVSKNSEVKTQFVPSEKVVNSSIKALTDFRKEREALLNSKVEKENKLLDAKIAKIAEEVIPKEHVIHIVVALAEGVKGAYARAADTFITQFAAQNSMPREEMIRWKKDLTLTINEAVEVGVKESKSNLKRIAQEYSGKKGKGERDDT